MKVSNFENQTLYNRILKKNRESFIKGYWECFSKLTLEFVLVFKIYKRVYFFLGKTENNRKIFKYLSIYSFYEQMSTIPKLSLALDLTIFQKKKQ